MVASCSLTLRLRARWVIAVVSLPTVGVLLKVSDSRLPTVGVLLMDRDSRLPTVGLFLKGLDSRLPHWLADSLGAILESAEDTCEVQSSR